MAILPLPLSLVRTENFDTTPTRFDNVGFVASGWQEAGAHLDAAELHERDAFNAMADSDPATDAIGQGIGALPNKLDAVADTKVQKYLTELTGGDSVRASIDSKFTTTRAIVHCPLTQLLDQGPACVPQAPTPPSVGGGGTPPPQPPILPPALRGRRADLLLPADAHEPPGALEKEVQPIAESAAATVNATPPAASIHVPPVPPEERRPPGG